MQESHSPWLTNLIAATLCRLWRVLAPPLPHDALARRRKQIVGHKWKPLM